MTLPAVLLSEELDRLANLAALPLAGIDRHTVLDSLRALQAADRAAISGVKFGRRFYAGPDVLDLASEAYGLFAHTGRASPYPGLPISPSMEIMQRDIVRASIALMHGGSRAEAVITSGGTESVILAVKSCLTRARALGHIKARAEIVAPWSSHPCLDKAAELMGVTLRRIDVGPDGRADLVAMSAAITPQTIMLYGAVPSYSYGLDDDIVELGALALQHNMWLHVDACMSGFLAPFARMNGEPIKDFDFAVPGVTSISVDLHKHGYSAKGASVLLFKTAEHAAYHGFTCDDYPLPSMSTPTLVGTAPGAPIASAWAVMRYLGVAGYRAFASDQCKARAVFVDAVRSVPGFDVMGDPLFSLIVVTSDLFDMTAVHRELEIRGWFTLLVRKPPGLHLNIGMADISLASDFAADLRVIAKDLT
jgi:glutamate/tyrosine decarboxylase-like PLP-dependent enzyme